MVFVNTVVIVQSNFAMSQQATAWALAAFGLGSMGAALTLPPLLDRISDRTVVISGALALALGLSLGPFVATTFPGLLGLWVILGCSCSLTLTPVGRVLRRSAHAEDRPALFAAQFALSHACWLIAYPLAGYVSASAGAPAAFWSLAMLCGFGAIVTAAIWPARENVSVDHSHDDLPADHPHVAPTTGTHSHEYIIDDLHRRWPN